MDYWDIDRLLMEDHPISCRFLQAAPGVGWLDPHARSRGISDLPAASKVELPLWLAEPLTKKTLTSVDTPEIFSKPLCELLQRGALQLRTRDKSPYYFELGARLAWLTDEVGLLSALVRGLTTRQQSILERTAGGIGLSETEEGMFLFPFTLAEERMYRLCKGASSEGIAWRAGTARTMRPATSALYPKE